MDVDGAIEGQQAPSQRAAREVVTPHHGAGRAHQQLEQRELHGREHHRRAGAQDHAAPEIERDVVHAELLGRAGHAGVGAALGAAQDRADASHQLARVEGLGEVVVGAELEADDAVHVVAPRREHQHGDPGRGPDGAEHVEAVESGQHHVQHGEVVAAGRQALHGAGAVRLAVEDEALPGEILAEQLAQLGVVVDQQHARRGARNVRSPCRGHAPARRYDAAPGAAIHAGGKIRG